MCTRGEKHGVIAALFVLCKCYSSNMSEKARVENPREKGVFDVKERACTRAPGTRWQERPPVRGWRRGRRQKVRTVRARARVQ